MSGLIKLEDVLAIIDKRTVKGKLQVAREVLKLPTIEPEPCEDAVSRQAAIDAFYKHPNIDWTTLDVLAKIDALPSALPKIVKCKDCIKQPLCKFSQYQGNDGYCSLAERRTDDSISD